jgi:hypothetical protein
MQYPQVGDTSITTRTRPVSALNLARSGSAAVFKSKCEEAGRSGRQAAAAHAAAHNGTTIRIRSDIDALLFESVVR